MILYLKQIRHLVSIIVMENLVISTIFAALHGLLHFAVALVMIRYAFFPFPLEVHTLKTRILETATVHQLRVFTCERLYFTRGIGVQVDS